jgi:hypothetical protein
MKEIHSEKEGSKIVEHHPKNGGESIFILNTVCEDDTRELTQRV